MSSFNATIKLDADKALVKMSATQKHMVPAQVSAINKTLTSVQSNVRRSVAKSFGVRAKDIRFRITLPRKYKASRNKLRGNVAGFFQPLKASKFGTPRQTKTGATVRGSGGGRRKFPGAFVARMPSGHTGVYKRRGQKRLPIVEQTVDLMPRAGRIAVATFNRVSKKIGATFRHELKRRARI